MAVWERLWVAQSSKYAPDPFSALTTEPHDPPLVGMQRDRVKRRESYTKDFKRMTLGEIRLEEGSGTLTLRALNIPGTQVMDFRTLLLTRQ